VFSPFLQPFLFIYFLFYLFIYLFFGAPKSSSYFIGTVSGVAAVLFPHRASINQWFVSTSFFQPCGKRFDEIPCRHSSGLMGL
jgi:hypothetical protein